MPKMIRSIVPAIALALAFSTPGLALLMYRTDDVYVRQSDVIIVADVVSLAMHGKIPVAEVEAIEVLMGSPPVATIHVQNFPDGREDMPYFRASERSLLFLTADFPAPPGVFWCVGAEATKRNLRSYSAEAWAATLDRVTHLVSVRLASDDQARTDALIRLLESEDVELVAAASNYLNYLATGEDDEAWIVNPPEDSSDWDWHDYFRRNAIAHREEWEAWWQARRAEP